MLSLENQIILSYTKPEFSYELVFKYLTYSRMNGIDASLVVTKIDLCDKKEELDDKLYTDKGIMYEISNENDYRPDKFNNLLNIYEEVKDVGEN
mgnify:CR=1 FL=1